MVRRPAQTRCPERLAHHSTEDRGARIASVPEAQLENIGSGLTPTSEGWFVVNVRDVELMAVPSA
jgi:hypothetical protein